MASMNTHAKTSRRGVSFTGKTFDQMCAWADARGLQNELFDVVVTRWQASRQVH